jgi:hypothetical protein
MLVPDLLVESVFATLDVAQGNFEDELVFAQVPEAGDVFRSDAVSLALERNQLAAAVLEGDFLPVVEDEQEDHIIFGVLP